MAPEPGFSMRLMNGVTPQRLLLHLVIEHSSEMEFES